MGLLDDAIREHLELKRRHGASDEEISQKETEALGPARRQPVEPEITAGAEPALDGDGQAPSAEPVAEPDVGVPDPSDSTRIADVPPLEGASLEEPPAAEAPPVEAPPGEDLPPPVEEPEPDEDLPPLEEPEPAVQEPPPLEEPAPMEPDLEDHLAPEEALPPDDAQGQPRDPASGDEDLLEETPDFLQDSPEHDQLWFEQKPPRDFDLD